MVILVTGANGQLGMEMRIVAKGSADKYIFTDVTEQEGVETTFLDITDLNAIRAIVKENNVGAIVNCAAWTNVDAAEAPENHALVEKLNATAPENLAKAMKEVGGWLVQISTDYVFGKEPYNTPCQPDQQGTPTGVYGQTKKLGEEKIIKEFSPLPAPPLGEGSRGTEGGQLGHSPKGGEGGGFIIIRTAWLYSEYGKNFCKTMLSLFTSRDEERVVADQMGTPTYAGDLAEAICDIIEGDKGDKCGTYHYSNLGECSWYDFAAEIAKVSGCNSCKITPCTTADYPTKATRPQYSVLDKSKFMATFNIDIPEWRESLAKCIKRLNNR